ncbi:putative membrane protein [Escherichia coli RN587/1]|nr:putative membrane protein [Escherichia coli RN587/1]
MPARKENQAGVCCEIVISFNLWIMGFLLAKRVGNKNGF